MSNELLTDEEIESLMNAVPDEGPPVQAEPKLEEFLVELLKVRRGISDINLSVGRPPQITIDGVLQATDLWERPLRPSDTAAFAKFLMGRRPELEAKIRRTGSCDTSHSLPSGERLRVNIFKVRSAFAVAMRRLPIAIPTLDALGLSRALEEIPKLRNGLVLVTGATGSGKSTTSAAILDRINTTRPLHIVTLEDPIEFLHPHKRSTVNQRELGRDFSEFGQGLRSALRQSPNVIFVGEIRDQESLDVTIKAAETGHLVLSTMHTIDAGQTINRIIGMYPNSEAEVVKYRLSQVLRFVISQRLLPKVGGGRVAAQEVMGNDIRVRALIREGESEKRTYYDTIAENQAKGWSTFDQQIMAYFARGVITEETAMAFCSSSNVVRREIDRLHTRQGRDTSGIGQLEMLDKKAEKDVPQFMSPPEIAPRRLAKPRPPQPRRND